MCCGFAIHDQIKKPSSPYILRRKKSSLINIRKHKYFFFLLPQGSESHYKNAEDSLVGQNK